MKINEKKVIILVLKFQKTQETGILKEIIRETSNMIYNYPLYIFHIRPDECSDFYIYLIERIRPLLLKYNASLSSFYTWFNILLKSQCINWLNTLQKKAEKTVKTKSIDDGLLPSDEEPIAQFKENESALSANINRYLLCLPVLDYLIIKLLYYSLDTALLDKLALFNGRDHDENIKLIRQLLNNNKKLDIQFRLSGKINLVQYKILSLKKRLADPLAKDKDILNKRLQRFTGNLSNYEKMLDHNHENFDIQSIAVLLNETQDKIYYRLNKIKNDLFFKLKDKLNYSQEVRPGKD